MSASEEAIKSRPVTRPTAPILNRVLDAISSVRVGVVTLCILVILAMTGMLILQQNVQGFDAYYLSLTPAEKMVFGKLGLFDIYHAWYFYFALLFLSLNIILASIDHIGEAWTYVVKPKLTATRAWLLNRRDHVEIPINGSDESVAERIILKVFQHNGLKPVTNQLKSTSYGTDADGKRDFSNVIETTSTVVFAQKGKFNRMGAYIIHTFLLTLFLGHFVALTTGFDADVQMVPGDKKDQIQKIDYDLDKKIRYNVKLPFTMECTDIQQRLINENAGIDVTNTMDWRTEMKITDPGYGEFIADIGLNRPVTYRGYRFFQSQTIPIGNARIINLELTPKSGGEALNVSIHRNGSATLADGTKVDYTDFVPDFTIGADGQPDTRSGDYNNPAAVLNVTPPDGERTRVFAFAQKLPDSAPIGAPKAGYKWRLASFEKSPLAHVLSIKYDPYNAAFIAWYIGGFGLVGALAFVFFTTHRRYWALIEKDENGHVKIVFAGESNRNHIAFTDRFIKMAAGLQAQQDGSNGRD